jgi:hypothetical protein
MNEVTSNIKLVDDSNLNITGLANRRLRMKALGAPLYPLRIAIFFMGDFLKLAKSNYWFIDSNGTVFNYKKSVRAKLVFRRIKRVIPARSTGSIIEVEGIPERFKTVFIVRESMKYAGILEYRGVSIFYGIYDKQYKDSWRMI